MYTIKQLSMISGLTSRTLRNYLKAGILKGTMKNGAWCFNEEQIDEFFKHNAVKSSMNAGRRALIFDYLNAFDRKENSACVILDLPKADPDEVARFFCDAVNKRSGLTMTFSKEKDLNRVILIGGKPRFTMFLANTVQKWVDTASFLRLIIESHYKTKIGRGTILLPIFIHRSVL